MYYLVEMLLPALVAALVFCAVRPLRCRRLTASGRSSSLFREVGLLLFVMFLAGLSMLTLTPYGFSLWRILFCGGQLLRLPPFRGGINLIPFQSVESLLVWIRRGAWSVILINYPGNVLMFLPVGFFPALLWDRPSWKRAVLVGFSASLLIEVFQLLVSRGTDVDDLILNTLGALCGYWLFLALRHRAPSFCSKFILEKMEAQNGRQAGN